MRTQYIHISSIYFLLVLSIYYIIELTIFAFIIRALNGIYQKTTNSWLNKLLRVLKYLLATNSHYIHNSTQTFASTFYMFKQLLFEIVENILFITTITLFAATNEGEKKT